MLSAVVVPPVVIIRFVVIVAPVVPEHAIHAAQAVLSSTAAQKLVAQARGAGQAKLPETPK